jgi:flagellar biosynthetic protein FliR
MNIVSYIPIVYEKFGMFVLVFTRISALFATFILFRRDYVNARIIIALSGVLSLYVIIASQEVHITYGLYSINMISQIFFETFVGFISGFILNIVFEVFSAFGQIVSTQIGLGMASLMDPKLGSITTLTHFYSFSVSLLFLFLNGHLYIIGIILDSFTSIPVGKIFLPSKIISDVLSYSGVIFYGSVMLSITIVIVIMLTNFALAVMSKFAPQFNLFTIGINILLIIGLIYVYLTFDLFSEKASVLIQGSLDFLQSLIMRKT